MKIEICSTRIMKETRQEKHVFTLSHCEMDYIVKHKALMAEEKLLWLLLASMSADEENLSCPFDYENIADKLGMSYSRLLQTVLKLEIMGFLKRYTGHSGERCSVRLPNAGLLHLRLASKKETPKWLKKLRYGAGKEVFMWW